MILFRKLIREMWSKKGALLALIVVTAVGIASYIGFGSVYLDLDAARRAYFDAQNLAHIKVSLKRAPNWTLEQVAEASNIARVRGRIKSPALVHLKNVRMPITGTAISMPFERRSVLNDVVLETGTWFTARNEEQAIVNNSFAEANGLRPGDTFKALINGKQHTLEVIGTASSPEYVYLISPDGGFAPDPSRFGVFYLTTDFLADNTELTGAYNQLLATLRDRSRTDITVTRLENMLDRYGVVDAGQVSDEPSVRYLLDELKGLDISGKIMPVIFLLFVALILNVLMGRYVRQQRTVIGTLKALGTSSAAIALHYALFGAIVGMFGGLAGCGLGYMLQTAMLDTYRQFYQMPGIAATFRMSFFTTSMAIAVVVCVVGSLRASIKAAYLPPATAMKPPVPPAGSRTLLERFVPFWPRLPFQLKMAFRSLARNPVRSPGSASLWQLHR
ncbi:MAG: ABC transporter permease [Planctomycetota bacterium]|nr:ABC transporter permease [Planctomycetota bacterium]